jgi:hypothetical protein
MNDRFILHRRARMTYQDLTPEERDALVAAVAPLAGLPVERWPSAGARKLATDEPLFLVPVDDSLRAFVQPTPGGQPEVLGLARQDTLRTFASDGAGRGEPG